MTELELELTNLLYHAKEIGNILKKNCNNKITSITIGTGGFHGPNHSLKTNQMFIEISTNTIREIQASTTTSLCSLNEINCKMQKRFGVTYDRTRYCDMYLEQSDKK